MLNDAAAVLKNDRAGTRAHRETHMGIPHQAGTDDDMIHVGDAVNYHYPQPPAKVSGWTKLATGVLGAAVGLAGAGGIGAGAVWLASKFTSSPSQLPGPPIKEQVKKGDGPWVDTGRVIRYMPDGTIQVRQPDGTWALDTKGE